MLHIDYYGLDIQKAQFSKAKWLRDMEARQRLFSWVSASDGLKVPVGGSSRSEGLCWPRLVPAILPRGFNSVNQVHQQLPLPLFLLRQTRSTSFSCSRIYASTCQGDTSNNCQWSRAPNGLLFVCVCVCLQNRG